MDDDKKKTPTRELETVLGELIVIFIVLYLIYRAFIGIQYGINSFLIHSLPPGNFFREFYADPSWRNLNRLTSTSWIAWLIVWSVPFLRWLGYLLSALFIAIIIWLMRELNEMGDAEAAHLSVPKSVAADENVAQTRWKQVVDHAQSANAANWRIAILEADIILEEILETKGYRGDSVSEKLKQVDTATLKSINDAWEAHKIRNAIAHEGEGFILTERESRRVIGLYEKVFKEYKYI